MRVLLTHIIVPAFLLGSSFSLRAQSFLLKSNEDFGPSMTLFCDNDYPSWPYTFQVLEGERMRVEYECALALEDQSKMIRAQYYLQIGERYSKFVSVTRHKVDSVHTLGGTIGGRIYDGKANFLFIEDCYYIDRKTGKLSFTGRLGAEDFLYEEPVPTVEWKVSDSSKVICGYDCRKAEGTFRGRTYVVWYTEELPASAGPWKLQGLPGVILEVEDTEHIHHVKATRVNKGIGDIIKTDYPYIKVSRKQYAKLIDQILADFSIFLSNHTSRSAAIVRIGPNHVPVPLLRPVFLEKE